MTQRLPFLDYTRLTAAYLVVLGHLLPITGCTVKNFIYTFHISLFFLISGMLHSYKGKIQIGKYIKTILIPAFFFLFSVGIIISVLSHFSLLGLNYTELYEIYQSNNLATSILNSCIFDTKNLLYGKIVTNGPCWFLFSLFFLKILADISKKSRWHLVAIIVLCPLLFVVSYRIASPFYLGRTMLALPFYFVGLYFKNNIIKIIYCKHNFILSAVCFCITSACLYINKQPSYTALSFGAQPIPFSTFFFYLGGTAGTFMTMFLFAKSKQNKYIESLSSALISIVGIQALFYKPIVFTFGRDLILVIYIFTALIITILCCACHKFLNEHAAFLIGKRHVQKKLT